MTQSSRVNERAEHRQSVRVDSLVVRDTVRLSQRGDTVFVEEIRWRERYRADTLRVHDTIREVSLERVETVKTERVRSWREVVIVSAVLALVFWMIKKRLRRN